VPQKQQGFVSIVEKWSKGLTLRDISANFSLSKRSLSTTERLRCRKKRHLQVRLGGGIRGPGPRANVGLEKAVSKEAAFFLLWFP
jgi:hypothetical protein